MVHRIYTQSNYALEGIGMTEYTYNDMHTDALRQWAQRAHRHGCSLRGCVPEQFALS